ncbi:MAG: D-aminoacyl-tRNA deacylase [Candidatus Nanoarchaeia archaeon]
MKLIVISETNLASKNIGNYLINLPNLRDVEFEKTKRGVLELDYIGDKKPIPKLVIVPSTHKSASGKAMISAHAPGNWASADLGGKSETLSIAPALYITNFLRLTKEEIDSKKINYEVGLEVTHHGPTIDLPIMFAEIGSSEKQWSDLSVCEIVATTILELLKKEPEKEDICVGFGGPHYAPVWTKKILSGKFAIGHICPSYHSDTLNEKMVLQAIEKTWPKPDFVALEWKGLKAEQREKIIDILEKHKINWEKI